MASVSAYRSSARYVLGTKNSQAIHTSKFSKCELPKVYYFPSNSPVNPTTVLFNSCYH